MKYEVRCCCTPKKLYGWIESKIGHRDQPFLEFFLLTNTKPIKFRLRPGDTNEIPKSSYKIIRLPFTLFHIGNDLPDYYALKSEETPLDDLRKLSCFTEAI